MLVYVLLLSTGLLQHSTSAYPSPDAATAASIDDGVSRRVLGSSVVTSVSVIMDKGLEKHYADAVGRPQAKPPAGAQVASPINLLNPDRYEFYTFNDSGDLVKRLMTLSEIQGIIANADGEAFNQNSHSPEKKVNDVVNNVQNVLKEEMQKSQNTSNMVLDTPDVSSTWNVILPAIFGNSGDEIQPAKSSTSHMPETITLDHQTAANMKKPDMVIETTHVPTITIALSNLQQISATTPRATIVSSTPAAPTSILTTQRSTTTETKPPLDLSTPFKRPPFKTTVIVTKRTTTPTERVSSTTANPTILPSVLESETATSTTLSQASSQFIQLFDPSSAVSSNMKTADIKYTRVPIITASPGTSKTPVGALFIIDEKTHTRIPITTKEQLATILSKLEVTTELSRNSSLDIQGGEPLLTFNSLTGHQTVQEPLATTSDIQSSTAKLDKDKYQQYLLSSTNIYDINKEFAKSTTSESIVSTITPRTIATDSLPTVTDTIPTTMKEPNLVDSIEQLIKQAVGDIQEGQKQTSSPDLPKVSYNSEFSTLEAVTTTDVGSTATEVPITDRDLLSEAMGSLLSQVAGSDFQGLSTFQELPTTTELQNKAENIEYRVKATDIFSETTESGTEFHDIIKTNTTNSGHTNEILKTDATTYNAPTEVAFKQESALPEHLTTLEPQRDLPIIFDLQPTEVSANGESPTNVTTELRLGNDQNLTEYIEIQSIDKDSWNRINKPSASGKITSTASLAPTTEKQATSSAFKTDSESVPSTNTYNEVRTDQIHNENVLNAEISTPRSTVTAQDSSTISLDALLKEFTAKDGNGQEIPKETTVLVITKPLYSTTTSIGTTTTILPKTSEVAPTSDSSDSLVPVFLKSAKDQSKPDPSSTAATTASSDSFTPQVSESPNEPEWTIVSTIAPHNLSQNQNASVQQSAAVLKIPQPPKPVELGPVPQLEGLEKTAQNFDQDVYQFVGLCNELAFGFWKSVTMGISSARSVFVSPFAATSLLAMVFLGARGATSGEMNEILRLDDMVTFNPHLIFKNVSESVTSEKQSGVATSLILRELYSDKTKGHLLNFYKERAKAFYDGHVEEVRFKEVGDIIRRRTNLIVKKQTGGKISEFVKDSSIRVRSPLAGVSASIFQTNCSDASVEGRDGELYFVVLPSIRQRRLVPVPAAVWRSNFLAGYEPGIDATAVALGSRDQIVSTIFVIPGQQGIAAPGDGLARLERHLLGAAFKDQAWSRLLQSLIPRPGLEVQIPRFQHRSIINATVALQQMGMKDLFDATKADLRGLNGVAHDLYLSDILQINQFATCGENMIADSHHSEIYPATANRSNRRTRLLKDKPFLDETYYDADISEEPRDYQRAFHDPLHDPSLYALPLPLRPRQARLPDPPRLRFDRPFLYFVRHNPTGLILHMGRFNPRLLP